MVRIVALTLCASFESDFPGGRRQSERERREHTEGENNSKSKRTENTKKWTENTKKWTENTKEDRKHQGEKKTMSMKSFFFGINVLAD
jgi:hypothetical protein